MAQAQGEQITTCLPALLHKCGLQNGSLGVTLSSGRSASLAQSIVKGTGDSSNSKLP